MSFKLGSNVLSKLYTTLLFKLRVTKTFLVAMRYSSLELGGLGLYFLEVESNAQAINHFTSLCIADILTRLLLKTMMEYVQLEIGAIEPFFLLQCKYYKGLAIGLWLVFLWRNMNKFNL